MAKKRLMIMVIFLFALISCDKTTPQDSTTAWRTGSQGLMTYFEANQPPNTIYSDQEFITTLRVENKGAFEVGGPFDAVYLSGFEPNIITGIPTQGAKMPKIAGKTKFDNQGGRDWVTFKGNIYMPQGVDVYDVDLQTTTCYKYETLASGNICIDPNPFSTTRRQKTCIPGNVALGTQAAPIAVSNIKTEASPQKTRFEITITNAGGGIVFRDDGNALKRCSPYDTEGLKFEDIDSVKILDVKIGDTSIQPCKNINNGYLRLVNGRGTMYCEMATSGSTEYVTNIKIDLSYGYQSQLTKRTRLINVNP